ncbi:MAG: PilZ domain-containing protein [Kordiimonadaceae bacterium]|nr:PilZ domain-containing protein [Kordiimonadaceae bacterium]
MTIALHLFDIVAVVPINLSGLMMSHAKNKPPEAPQQTSNSRLFQRRSVLWPAKLLVGRHTISCQIWNLSLGGARVRVDLPIRDGTDVILAIQGRGELSATVVWVDDEAMGLDFNVPSSTIKKMFEDRLHVLGLDAKVE